MLPVVFLLLAAAPGPTLHLSVRSSSCRIAEDLRRGLGARMPELRVELAGAAGPEDRTAVLAEGSSGYRLELWDAHGRRELLRQLPATCETAGELASAVLERHFAEVSWPPEAPELELPSPPPLVELPEPESGWSGALMLGLTATTDGDQPFIPGASAEAWAQWRWLQFGALLASTLPQTEDVVVRSRSRGSMTSRLDGGAAFASACRAAFEGARACAGPAVGISLLTGSAEGSLYQLTGTTVSSANAGATGALQWSPAGHFLVGLRVTALVPFSRPTVQVEGTSAVRTVSLQALASLNLGWSFF